MNVKIHQPSTKTYNNSGSCRTLAEYLDKKRKEGKSKELYFNHEDEHISKLEVINDIDTNKGQLGKGQSKFFGISVSPSAKELKHLGNTKDEQAHNLKSYVNDVMQKYAKNFGKGLNKEDLKYYAKIHYNRDRDNSKNNMHAHIIVSRKDQSNSIKLSPLTNHKGTERGAVKGGFERTKFYDNCEKGFDKKFDYSRNLDESFKYLNAQKYGRIEEIKQMKQEQEQKIEIEQAPIQEQNIERLQGHEQKQKIEKEQKQKQEQEQIQKGLSKGLGM